MPSRLNTPVLTVDVNLIRKVDTRNVENLFSMWTVFSRCASSLEEGRRLENLSWRIWNRETFCCDPSETATPEPAAVPTAIPQSRSTVDMPSLSGSVDSLADDDAIEEFDVQHAASTSAPLDIARPLIKRTDSTSSQVRGRERHITPDDLEKMVITIKETKQLEPLPHSKHPYLTAVPKEDDEEAHEDKLEASTELAENAVSASTTTPSTIASDSVSAKSSMTAVSSDASSAASERSTTSIVRGFSPSHISSSFRRVPLPSLKEPSPLSESSLAAIPETTTQSKKPAMFALGGSSQSDNESYDHSSMEMAKHLSKKKAQFALGGSSNEEESSLTKALRSQPRQPSFKRPTFKENLTSEAIQEETAVSGDVFETDDEDDVDESAIDDDDDDSGWEDSLEESGKSSIDEKTFFQRVDSRPNLASRRSLITTMLHQNERASAMAAAAQANGRQRSRTSSPNGPSVAASPTESDDGMHLMMKKKPYKSMHEIPRSSAQPIMVAPSSSTHQTALSPKTTRRNMLNSELTQSLRRHMLWERQYLNSASTQLPRRHTSHDVANLKQYPEKVHLGNDDKDNASYNQYFGANLGGYHSKGW